MSKHQLAVRRLCQLDLSAASGLVVENNGIWVVADNYATLQRYGLSGRLRQRIALDREAGLKALAKPDKPDLEALVSLPGGRLLALGSGSKSGRARGFLVDSGNQQVRKIDLSGLFRALDREFHKLNIEGAAVAGDALVLAQRGNSKHRENALVYLDLDRVLADLERGELTAAGLGTSVPVELGERDGTPLSLTDLAMGRDGHLYFSAAAERSDDPYEDAPCAGSALGLVGRNRDLSALWPLKDSRYKIEGLHPFKGAGPGMQWLLVADADDEAVPAPLLRATTPATASGRRSGARSRR